LQPKTIILCKGLSTPGNKVAENGNNLLPGVDRPWHCQVIAAGASRVVGETSATFHTSDMYGVPVSIQNVRISA